MQMTDEGSSKFQETSQYLRDFKLAIEFKYLMTHAPGGVYLMPEFDDIRKLHGVIFVRRGIYRDGIFRFKMILDKKYNSINIHPTVIFTPPVFHPLIHPETGNFDFTVEPTLKEWLPEKHILSTALAYIKKAFYMTSFDMFLTVPNETARVMFQENKEMYLEKIQHIITSSQERLYDPPVPGCTLYFTEPKPAHQRIRDRLFQTHTSSSSGNSRTNTTSGNTDHSSSSSTQSPIPSDLYNTRSYDGQDSTQVSAEGEGGISGVDTTSDKYMEQLLHEVKKPFVYDSTNDAEDAAERSSFLYTIPE